MSPQRDTGVLSHCVCQVLIKSNAKYRLNRSNVTNNFHPIWTTRWAMKTYIYSANFLLDLVHLSAVKSLGYVTISFWKSGFSPLSGGNLVFLCMFWPDRATRVSNVTLCRERLERGRGITSGRSHLRITHATGRKRNCFTSWLSGIVPRKTAKAIWANEMKKLSEVE